jgi:hypothetical protein
MTANHWPLEAGTIIGEQTANITDGNTKLIIPPGRATNEWRGRRDSNPRPLPCQSPQNLTRLLRSKSAHVPRSNAFVNPIDDLCHARRWTFRFSFSCLLEAQPPFYAPATIPRVGSILHICVAMRDDHSIPIPSSPIPFPMSRRIVAWSPS